jgi:hypothetical protein
MIEVTVPTRQGHVVLERERSCSQIRAYWWAVSSSGQRIRTHARFRKVESTRALRLPAVPARNPARNPATVTKGMAICSAAW